MNNTHIESIVDEQIYKSIPKIVIFLYWFILSLLVCSEKNDPLPKSYRTEITHIDFCHLAMHFGIFSHRPAYNNLDFIRKKKSIN